MENFNTKYRAWKESMVKLINEGGIPLAVVADFLATLQGEIARTLMQEEMQQKDNQEQQKSEEDYSGGEEK